MCKWNLVYELSRETTGTGRLFRFLSVCGIGRYDEGDINVSKKPVSEEPKQSIYESPIAPKIMLEKE